MVLRCELNAPHRLMLIELWTEKVGPIPRSQSTNLMYGLKKVGAPPGMIPILPVELPSAKCHRTILVMSQHWFW